MLLWTEEVLSNIIRILKLQKLKLRMLFSNYFLDSIIFAMKIFI